MIQSSKNFVNENIHYAPLAATYLAYGLTGAIIVETGFRIPYDIFKIIQTSNQFDKLNSEFQVEKTALTPKGVKAELDNHRYNLWTDMGHCLFYSLCAYGIFPGSLFVGATVFALYSIRNCEKKDTYLATKHIGKALCALSNKIKLFADYCFEKLGKLFNWAYEGLCFVGRKLSLFLPPLSMPKRPWIGVAVLIAAAVVINYVR